MTKKEAVEVFVQREFSRVPTPWVQIVAESTSEYHTFPMWGTMWFMDSVWGEKLWDRHSAMVVECERHAHSPYAERDGCGCCGRYSEEMEGERVILDTEGNATVVYLYEIDGEYLIGVHGAGWDFYDGVWDMLYDVLGLCWHQEELSQAEVLYNVAI